MEPIRNIVIGVCVTLILAWFVMFMIAVLPECGSIEQEMLQARHAELRGIALKMMRENRPPEDFDKIYKEMNECMEKWCEIERRRKKK